MVISYVDRKYVCVGLWIFTEFITTNHVNSTMLFKKKITVQLWIWCLLIYCQTHGNTCCRKSLHVSVKKKNKQQPSNGIFLCNILEYLKMHFFEIHEKTKPGQINTFWLSLTREKKWQYKPKHREFIVSKRDKEPSPQECRIGVQ